MLPAMQEFAIMAAQVRSTNRILLHTAFDASLGLTLLLQDAIANYTTENDVSSAIKAKFETSYPST